MAINPALKLSPWSEWHSRFGVTCQRVVFVCRRFRTPCRFHLLGTIPSVLCCVGRCFGTSFRFHVLGYRQGVPKRRPTNTTHWLINPKLELIKMVIVQSNSSFQTKNSCGHNEAVSALVVTQRVTAVNPRQPHPVFLSRQQNFLAPCRRFVASYYNVTLLFPVTQTFKSWRSHIMY